VDEAEFAGAATAVPSTPPSETEPAEIDASVTFAEGYRKIVPRLVAFLRYQGVPLTDAADVVQETMIHAYRQWDTITHPMAWARRVASRLWARRLAGTEATPIADFSQATPLLKTNSDIAEWEQQHDILSVLDQLPSRQRQVLAWTLEGHSPSEIAAELRMTPEAVRSSLKLARRAVAALLTLGSSDD
jgi:RNA polymerase sigma factor (sigma-70 family)